MEVKRDVVLLINLLYRFFLLIGFVSEYEAPNSPLHDPIFNWNHPVTDRVVLILANGLRDDFFDQNSTPFLKDIRERNGTVAKVQVDGILSGDSGAKLLLTGDPSHASVFPWNRPASYNTILHFIPCKCVIGKLPLEETPQCHYQGETQADVFRLFEVLVEKEKNKDCLYVISFDFAGSFERDYKRKLRRLDEDVRRIVNVTGEKWRDSTTTWVLTSSRGFSLWNRTDGSVNVPVVVWGHAILHVAEEKVLRLVDVPALVSALLGKSFPAGSQGRIPTYFLNVSDDAKFHMVLYNSKQLKGMMVNEEDKVRSLKGEDITGPQTAIEDFLHVVDNLHGSRMRVAAVLTILSFLLWDALLVMAVIRGTLTVYFTSWTVAVTSIAIVSTIVYVKQSVAQIVLLQGLLLVVIHSYVNIVKSFLKESYRTFLFSAIGGTALTALAFFRNVPSIFIMPILLWPFLSRLVNRMNKKVLILWVISSVGLMALPFVPVFGKDPSPLLVAVGGALHVPLFFGLYHVFKRRIDFQCWVITTAVLFSSCVVYLKRGHGVFSVLPWGLIVVALISTRYLTGTLMEQYLKFLLVLSIPYQLLSIRHETVFFLILTTSMFAWVFIENLPGETLSLTYNPSVFNIEKPAEFFPEKLHVKHYRQMAFFWVYCYVSFFAAGNIPSVYSYDLNIAEPFGDCIPFALVLLKLLIPNAAVVSTLVVIQYIQKRDPSPLFVLSLYFADVFASCLLTYTYFITDTFTFNVSHYIVFQIMTISVSVVYFLERYILLGLAT